MSKSVPDPECLSSENEASVEVAARVGRYEWHVADDRLLWSAGLLALYDLKETPSGESPFSLLVHPDDRVRVEAETNGFLTSSALAYSHSFRILRPDGEVRYILDRGVIVRDQSGRAEVIRGVNVDLTDLPEMHPGPADERVAQGFAELEALYAEAPLGLALLDQELRFVRINSALAQMNGFAAEDHVGRRVWDLLPDLRETAEAALQRVLATGLPLRNVLVTGETPARPGDIRAWHEHFYPLRGHDGRVHGIGIVCEEVTDRLANERRLAESEERFRQMADDAPMMVWETGPDGACSFLSRSWYEFTGQTPEQALGFGWLKAVHPEDAPESERIFREANAGHQGFRLDYRLRRADGVYRWAIDSARPRISADGNFLGFIGSVIDITERKEAEALKSYLLRLSDKLRPLHGAVNIQAEAARMLCEELGASRTAYFDIRGDSCVIKTDHSPATPSLLGSHPITLFGGDFLKHHGRLEPIVVPDVSETHSGAERDSFKAVQVGAYIAIPLVKDGEAIAGFAVHSQAPRAWTATDVRMAEETAERIWAAEEQARAEKQRHETEQRYRTLFDAIDEGFCVVEVRFDAPDDRTDYRVVEANPAFYQRTGFPEAILGLWLREAVPALEEHWYEVYGRVARTGEAARFEQSSDALGRWFDVYAFRIGPPEDCRVAILFNDISERKRHEERMQLLTQEANHRAKNMLALVDAIARQTASFGSEDFPQRFGARVQALAASQDLLIQTDWKGTELGALILSQLAHFKELIGLRIILSGGPVLVGPQATQTLGLALHELGTNSAKYGALSNAAGRVEISWDIIAADGDDHLSLSWRESNGPAVVAPTRKGFGHRVVKTMVERSLSGRVTLKYAPAGVVWALRCPVDALRAL